MTAPSAWQLRIASAPRPGRGRNEDLALTLGGLVVVLDGARTSELRPGLPDAHWYVNRLALAIASMLDDDPALSLASALGGAIKAVAVEHAETSPSASASEIPSATVGIVRTSGPELEYLVLGDVTLLLESRTGVTLVSDRRLAAVNVDTRQGIRQHLEAGGRYDAPAYLDLLADLIGSERAARNVEGGYWIAAADPGAAAHALTGSLPVGGSPGHVRRFALLTDGLSRAVTTFGLYTSWDDFMAALAARGPDECIADIRAAEAADPDGIRFPRTSPTDDATGVVGELIA